MSILKFKAKLYQWTGIYLANSEELEYLKSKTFWRAFKRIKGIKENADKQGILIGLWQYKHGFYRSFRLQWCLLKGYIHEFI